MTSTNPEVTAVFDAYPRGLRLKLMELRQLIFDVAAETEGVGKLEEALKWGQPSYLTSQSKSGSTIRIDQVKSEPGKYAMYFICHTDLVATFRQMYDDLFTFEEKRAIIFDAGDDIPEAELAHCIALALTYHLNKKRRS